MSDEIRFFDRSGTPVAYALDNEHIYLWNGKPAAYLQKDCVFAFSGELLGWFASGWIRDRDGRYVLFTPDASGGPNKPARKAAGVKPVRQVRPVKGEKEVVPVRPVNSSSWSDQVFPDLA